MQTPVSVIGLGARRHVAVMAMAGRSSLVQASAASARREWSCPAIQVMPRRRSRPGVAAGGRVGHVQLHQADINANGRRRHLLEGGVRPLAHLGPGVAQHHALDFVLPCSSMIASHFSGAPKEKPTFLNEQAMPRPLRSDFGLPGRD
jgi:hypothetical protein